MKTATKDLTNFDLTWSGRILKDIDPLSPNLLDDPTPLDNMAEGSDIPYRDILAKVKF